MSYIRLRTMTLKEGLEYLRAKGQKRKIAGHWVEDKAKKAATRLHMFASGKTECVECGLQGDHFHIERHKNDKVMPFSINLYAWRNGKEVMMTWDHILPKSWEGSNSLENAQCMCKTCNERKGNKLSIHDIIEIVSHPDVEAMYKAYTWSPKATLRDTIGQVQAEFAQLGVSEDV